MAEWQATHADKWREGYTSLAKHEWNVIFENLRPDPHVLRIMKWNPEMERGGVLHGPPGVGKSTLGKALINRWASENYRALFITIGCALDNIRNAIDSTDTTQAMEMEKLIRPNFLFIDDFGTEKLTEFTEDKFFTVIDSRWKSKKHTWFSTNLGGDEIKKRYPARISDRMLDMCSWIACEGESYRRGRFKNEI